MLPPTTFLVGYLVRGVVLWVGIHLAAGGVIVLADLGGPALLLHLSTIPYLVGAVCLASALEDRVRRDTVLLANLGISPFAGAATSGAVALIAEAALQLAGRAA